jgi:regulator of nucleoside diphosphate kinase
MTMSYLHPELPPIAITRGDMEKLTRIADSSAGVFAQTAEFLGREIERAQVIEEFESRPGLVKMGSRVTFRDDVTSQVRAVTLVYPGEADVSQGKISVLTPVGAALIGLSVSQSIEWETQSGGRRSLTVLAVDSIA